MTLAQMVEITARKHKLTEDQVWDWLYRQSPEYLAFLDTVTRGA